MFFVAFLYLLAAERAPTFVLFRSSSDNKSSPRDDYLCFHTSVLLILLAVPLAASLLNDMQLQPYLPGRTVSPQQSKQIHNRKKAICFDPFSFR